MDEKRITSVAFWQLLGKFALQGIAFITVPIMTRLLNTTEYGYSSLFNSWANFVTLFIGLNTYGSIANARITYNEQNFNKYLSSVFTVSCFSFLFISVITLVLKPFLPKLLGLSYDLCLVLLVYCFSTYTVSFYVAKLDQQKKAKQSAVLSFSMNMLTMIVAVACVCIFKNNKVSAKIYGQTAVHVLFGFVIAVYIFLKGRTLFNKDYWKFCLPLTLPLVFHSLGQLIFTQSDHIMVQKFLSNSSLGIYGLVCTLSGVLMIIYGALNATWIPFYYDYKKAENESEIVTHSKKYIRLFTVITCGFLCLAPEVFKLIAPQEYWSGLKIIPLLCCSYFFGFIYLFPVNFEFYCKKTVLIPISTCIVAIVNVILNFFWIKLFGEIGAAYATLVSYVIYFVLHFTVAKYIIPATFEYKLIHFMPYIFVVFVFTGIYYFFLNNMCFIRWSLASTLTVFQIWVFIKNKAIF